MNIEDKTIVLTGAAGGIGSEIAKQLDQSGAKLILIDLNESALKTLTLVLNGKHTALTLNIATDAGRDELFEHCSNLPQGIDCLINSAGVMDFSFTDELDGKRLELVMNINVIMPILLTKSLLPLLKNKSTATSIVNIGSTFGSIGYPGFSAYCSSKFALRGFTETLRRELSDSTVSVLYIAPRAAATKLNNDAITGMNKELKTAMDSPQLVANKIVTALKKQKTISYLGWPEKLFVRVNNLFPKIVDNALKKQLPIIRRYAQQNQKEH